MNPIRMKNKNEFFEPIPRFLKTGAIFIEDHAGKEDKFFDSIEEGRIISAREYELV